MKYISSQCNDNRKAVAAQAKLTPPLQKTEWNDKINPIIRETGCFALRISRVEAASEDTDRL